MPNEREQALKSSLHFLAGLDGRGLRSIVGSMLVVGVVLMVGAVRGQSLQSPASPVGILSSSSTPGYVGSQSCAGCHAAETTAWSGSQHARAMQPATQQAVLGDFADAHAEHFGSKARFTSKEGAFFIATEGKDGKTAAFHVDYTFGLEPLQQYLTTFPDGRVQALPYAWDTRSKEAGGQRWIHLYPDEAIPPGDVLHWTGGQQNWNFMCADCHSTAVRKGYDRDANRYRTAFSEISVGCESCHGPAADHVAWAAGPRDPLSPQKGFPSIAAKRPAPDWTPDPATGSPAHGVSRPVGDEVETCGTCHSRRSQFGEGWRPGTPLTDFYRPVFLTPGLFEDDGQMKDEVFNYAPFQQSKMFAKGVVCTDCHEPHGGKLRAAGSEVCSQCHVPQKFAAKAHTGHESGPGQPDCIACHMPAKTYMVIDARHDHSFRVPRPDLSLTLGTPNTCNTCHSDKPASWAAAEVERLHGPMRKGFQTYAPAFHAARTDAPEARALLLSVVNDGSTPAIARASALSFLQGRPGAEVDKAMVQGLLDSDPMVRIAALSGLASLPPDQRWRLAGPVLSDPVRAVRLEAVTLLAEGPPPNAAAALDKAFDRAADEYVAAQRFSADRAEGRSNLAGFLVRQGRTSEAEQEYLAAMKLSASVVPRVELADLYRILHKEPDAELLLRQTISIDPRAGAPRYALGLSLIRQKRYDEAVEALKRALEVEPDNARFAYVYAVALQSTGKASEATQVLELALTTHPSDAQILTLLLQGAVKSGDLKRALPLADRLAVLQPDNRNIAALLTQLRKEVGPVP